MIAGGTGANHVLHEIERVQLATETGLGVGNDRREPVDTVIAVQRVKLVGADERVVDPFDHLGHRVDRVQALVRIHLAGQVCVRRHLPTGQVDGLEAGLDLLHGLVARERTQRVDEGLFVHQAPELLRALPGQGMLDPHRATQALDVFGRVVAANAVPAGIFIPSFLNIGVVCHRVFPP